RRDGPPDLRVTVLEGADRLGGKLRVSELGGLQVDEGAETFLARAPEGIALAAEVGLSGQLAHPVTTTAGVVVGGRARPLPAGTVLGVPTELEPLRAAGVLDPAALAEVAAEPSRPLEPLHGDVAVGEYVGRRLGRQVVDRLVEPLLGGVYAGRAVLLSLHVIMPGWVAALAHG